MGEIEMREREDRGKNSGHHNMISTFHNQNSEKAALKVVSWVVSAL